MIHSTSTSENHSYSCQNPKLTLCTINHHFRASKSHLRSRRRGCCCCLCALSWTRSPQEPLDLACRGLGGVQLLGAASAPGVGCCWGPQRGSLGWRPAAPGGGSCWGQPQRFLGRRPPRDGGESWAATPGSTGGGSDPPREGKMEDETGVTVVYRGEDKRHQSGAKTSSQFKK